ncbi:hypothetical protein A2165_04595 [Candidatus Curtissbacteria bacterium RBG_13_40_7]|uniref:Uncharacterized protein n=1 Tax=Candidatus Curtissbacteria bacterium RBG_13_40_7 TaxID=1797706 RepID=A0A1F5FZD0_9BACT|nr:MAG: hypothetical protein A2165_04595 [Candidatus Curtissbacteria bacterium RBG_13_40_7]
MKQLILTDIADAFADEPMKIGDRLQILGISKKESAEHFAKDLLETVVHGSSFLKFFQNNIDKLSFDDNVPAEGLPENYVNPYEDKQKTIDQRLSDLEMTAEDKLELFDQDTLDLLVSGQEFTDFLVSNKQKFLEKLGSLAMEEKTDAT